MAGAGHEIIGTPGSDEEAVVVVLKGGSSTPVPSGTGPATAAVTRVPANAANVTLLAANTNRRGAVITNSSATQALFIKFGATANIGAGTESYTAVIPANAFASFVIPTDGYTGRIDGIWAGADANGEALITELTT